MSVEASVPLRRLLAFIAVLSVDVALTFLDDGLAQSKGQMSIAVDFSSVPASCAPAEILSTGSPYAFPYPMHDALIQPFPENAVVPLAWRNPRRRASRGCPAISSCERA